METMTACRGRQTVQQCFASGIAIEADGIGNFTEGVPGRTAKVPGYPGPSRSAYRSRRMEQIRDGLHQDRCAYRQFLSELRVV